MTMYREYAEILFVEDEQIFLSLLNFLIESLTKKGDEEVLAHIASETLTSLLVRASVK